MIFLISILELHYYLTLFPSCKIRWLYSMHQNHEWVKTDKINKALKDIINLFPLAICVSQNLQGRRKIVFKNSPYEELTKVYDIFNVIDPETSTYLDEKGSVGRWCSIHNSKYNELFDLCKL